MTQLVQRSAILKRLEESECPIVVITAPPGYGKSTVIRQWVAHLHAHGDHEVVQYRFPQHGSTVQMLLEAVASQVGVVGPPSGRTLSAMDAKSYLARLFAKNAQTTTLIIDDFESCPEGECLGLVRALVEDLPASVRLFISGRAVTGLPLARLRVAGNILFLDKMELQFTSSETAQLFKTSDPTKDVTIARMEGWATGLALLNQLSQRPVAAQPAALRSHSFVKPLPQHVANIFDYFAEEVDIAMSDEVKRLIASISVLDVVSGPLAAELSSLPDAPEVLSDLAARGLFVDEIQGEEPVYRLHPVFKDYVMMRLSRRLRLDHAALHRKSALYFARAGDLGLALRHASLISDLALSEQCAQMCRSTDGGFRYPTEIWSVFDQVSDDRLQPYVSILLGQSHLAMHRGEITRARKLLTWAENAVEERSEDGFTLSARRLAATQSLLLSNYEAWPAAMKGLEKYETAQASLLPQAEPEQQALELEVVSWMCSDLGDFLKGLALAERSVAMAARDQLSIVKIYADLAVATHSLELGKLQHARESAKRARALAYDWLGADANLSQSADIFEAVIDLDAGQPVAAYHRIKGLLPAVLQGEIWANLSRHIVRIVCWGAYLSEGYESGLNALTEIEAQLSPRSMRDWSSVITLQKARIALASGDLDGAAQYFETVEPLGTLPGGLPSADWNHSLAYDLTHVAASIAFRRTGQIRSKLQHIKQSIDDKSAKKYLVEYEILAAGQARLLRQPRAVTNHLIAAMEMAEETQCFFAFIIHAKLLGKLWAYVDDNAAGHRQLALMRPKIQRAIADASALHDEQEETLAKYPESLSPREGTVFTLLVDGLTSKEIANQLDISFNTVLGYRKSIYRKLGVSGRSMLVEISRSIN